jgi:hypothetical protein|tara:strand:- start:217 stop:405 length:189 start_codon:yes stop_codon:yes gene_type:complete
MEISLESYKTEKEKCIQKMVYYENEKNNDVKKNIIKLLNYLEKKDPNNDLDINYLRQLLKSI